MLVYGPNGSGKSSLYWALHTFLQSARKPTPGVAKYFDPGDTQNLLNIYEQAAATPKPGEIALTLREVATAQDKTYRISQALHETRQHPLILNADLASDFITYRFFFGFSHFRHSEPFNLWPLFEREILPFCRSTGGAIPVDLWNQIRSGDPNPSGSRGLGGASAYAAFREKTESFASILTPIVDSISTEAQQFYDRHYAQDDAAKITLKLGVKTPPSFEGTNQATGRFVVPVVEFGIQVGGNTIARPQAYLNEAKMTQLALSVRFAASLVNLRESDIKLLVLDDLLVSLDMSNRMTVVGIILSGVFDNYQKIILTHDHGFFREFRRKVRGDHPDWCFLHFDGRPETVIDVTVQKTEIQKAEEYLHGHSLDEAALCLRKAAEDTASRFLDRDNVVDPTKDFTGLRENLRAARNRVLAELPVGLYERVLRNTPDGHHALLLPPDDADLDANGALDAATKGKLKCQRRRLRELMCLDHLEQLRRVRLIDDVLACTERVLNPAAHGGNPPLYEKEVADALALIRQLQHALSQPALAASSQAPGAVTAQPAPTGP